MHELRLYEPATLLRLHALLDNDKLIAQLWGPVCTDKNFAEFRGCEKHTIGAAEVQALLEGLCAIPLLPASQSHIL